MSISEEIIHLYFDGAGNPIDPESCGPTRTRSLWIGPRSIAVGGPQTRLLMLRDEIEALEVWIDLTRQSLEAGQGGPADDREADDLGIAEAEGTLERLKAERASIVGEGIGAPLD